jgi:hypothetical protein
VEAPEGTLVKHLEFALAQHGVTTQGEGSSAELSPGWVGQAPANGLELGPAYAFGAATLVTPAPHPGFTTSIFQTFTWFEEVTVRE